MHIDENGQYHGDEPKRPERPSWAPLFWAACLIGIPFFAWLSWVGY